MRANGTTHPANVEGGSTRLTVQGVRAEPMLLKYRKLGYSERESEGVARGNIFGRPLQAAVHVANWHISDQFIVVNLDRLRVIESLLAHGADVNGRNTMEEPVEVHGDELSALRYLDASLV